MNTNIVIAAQAVANYIETQPSAEQNVVLTSVTSADIYNRHYVVRGVRNAFRRCYVVDVEHGFTYETIDATMSDEQAVDAAIAQWIEF